MAQTRLVFEEDFDVSPERVWAAISDHEGMSRWLEARVSIVARGDASGVGTVRRVRARGLAIDEEVVYADRPRRLVYRIVRGVPVAFHRGEMIVEARGATGAHLRWDIVLVSGVPGAAALMGAVLRPQLTAGLRKLRGQLSAAAAGDASAASAAPSPAR